MNKTIRTALLFCINISVFKLATCKCSLDCTPTSIRLHFSLRACVNVRCGQRTAQTQYYEGAETRKNACQHVFCQNCKNWCILLLECKWDKNYNHMHLHVLLLVVDLLRKPITKIFTQWLSLFLYVCRFKPGKTLKIQWAYYTLDIALCSA